jgi:hypothetical protein
MPRKGKGKSKQTQRHHQALAPSPQPVAPLEQAQAEAINPPNQAATSQPQIQPAQPRGKAAWLQTWLPIIFNGLVVLVIISHAFYYKRQWQAMQDSLKETRASRELDNRAWVTVKEAVVERIGVGQEVIVAVVLTNNGHSPATNVSGKIKPTITGTPLSYNKQLMPTDLPAFDASDYAKPQDVIGPGTDSTIRWGSGSALDEKTLADLTSNKVWLSFYGLVEYKDVFNQPHWTTFCVSFDGKINRLRVCGGGVN